MLVAHLLHEAAGHARAAAQQISAGQPDWWVAAASALMITTLSRPAVAALRVSGTFPVDDTDKALRAITSVLPVSIERRTRYWVTVSELNTA